MSSTLKYKKRFERFCHDGTITSVALDTSGSILAAGSLDGNISIWAVDTGCALHRVNARTPILSLVWLTGSEGFVFGCENGILASVLLKEVRPRCPSPSISWVSLIQFTGVHQNRVFSCSLRTYNLYITRLQ
jgi:WD40 repeat protein